MAAASLSADARSNFHALLLDTLLWPDEKDVPTNSDKDQKASVVIALGILDSLVPTKTGRRLSGQRAGVRFEEA